MVVGSWVAHRAGYGAHRGSGPWQKLCVCLRSAITSTGQCPEGTCLCWDKTHTHCPEVALGLELHMVLGHLKEAGVRGKVVAHGVLPALRVVPKKGDHHLELMDDLG